MTCSGWCGITGTRSCSLLGSTLNSKKKALHPLNFQSSRCMVLAMGSFVVPEVIPAMVIREVVFFPQSILPLYIFEQHYRQMLEKVIKGDRVFTVVSSFPDELSESGITSAINETVTLGYVKACQTYSDGSSMVMLAGLCRLTVQEYLSDAPYLQLRVKPSIEPPTDPSMLEDLREQTLSLLEKIHDHGGEVSNETLHHLRQINVPQHFVDHAAASFLKNTTTTQTLLNCSDPVQRYSTLLTHLHRSYYKIELLNSIVGDIDPDDIQRN